MSCINGNALASFADSNVRFRDNEVAAAVFARQLFRYRLVGDE